MRGGPLWKVPVTDRFDLESFDLEYFEKGVTTKRSLITIYGFKGSGLTVVNVVSYSL